ncbi:hypothetical protein R1flu_015460 [Riccia fluitans]|uniref:Uncharacterized protein n=1 Tax=Riccia fluitans TaxID=41844 RepID=A0ABD1YM63_9MARC
MCVVFLLSSCCIAQAYGTTFTAENRAPNTPGGMRFNNEIRVAWTVDMLQEVKAFIINTFSLSPEKERDLVPWYLEDFDGAASSSNNEIHVSAGWLDGLAEPGDSSSLKFELQGVMYHEMTHIWQNNLGDYGNDQYFRGVIEGIATWMELVAGFGIDPKVKGGNWYDGYTNTAHFLDWIDSTKTNSFVNQLNQKMGLEQWSNDFFFQLTGTDVDSLWSEYQASS